MSIPSPLTRHVDGGMLGFECATFTTHVCMRARVILVEAQKLETSKGRRAPRRLKSEKKPIYILFFDGNIDFHQDINRISSYIKELLCNKT